MAAPGYRKGGKGGRASGPTRTQRLLENGGVTRGSRSNRFNVGPTVSNLRTSFAIRNNLT